MLQGTQVALVVKNQPANAGDIRGAGLISGLGRSPGVGNDNPLWYSCLEMPWTEEPAGLQKSHDLVTKGKVAQSCLTLHNLMDCIVHGILQARTLEWVTFPLSRGSSQLRDRTQVSRIAGGFFTN